MKPEDVKPEDVKPEDVKPEDVKPEDVKPEDVKPEDVKPEDVKPEDVKPEDVKPEDVKPEDVKPEDPKPEDPKPVDPKPEDPKPDPDPQPEEIKDDDTPKAAPLVQQSPSSNGVTLSGELPEGVTLSVSAGVEPSSGKKSVKKARSAAASGTSGNYKAVYDISLILDGEAIQPDGSVTITLPGGTHFLPGDVATVIHYLDDPEAIAKATETYNGLPVEIFSTERGNLSVSANGTATFTTTSLSTFSYTVDFHNGELEFSIPGESSVLLSTVFTELNYPYTVADVESVSFSNPDLLAVEATENGDWLLTSLEPFDTDETLTIVFKDGRTVEGTLEIAVTDDSYDYAIADSNNGTVYAMPGATFTFSRTSQGGWWKISTRDYVSYAKFHNTKNNTTYDIGTDWNSASQANITIIVGQESQRTATLTIKSGSSYIGKSFTLYSAQGAARHDEVSIPINIVGHNYSVTFNKNTTATVNNMPANDSVSNQTAESKTFSWTNVPTRTGYTFGGWYANNGGTGTKYTDSVTLTNTTKHSKTRSDLNSSITLYAKWTPIDYTISYTLNDGSVSPANPTTYNIETATITLKNPTREGYTFKGWSGTGLTGDTNTSVSIPKGSTGNRSYTANWTPTTYTVTYNSNGGSSVSSQDYTIETNLTLRGAPTRNGYTFTGWKLGTAVNTWAATSYSATQNVGTGKYGNVTLVAQWSKDNYTITYDPNGGNAVNPTTYTITTQFDLRPKPSGMIGKEFLGWKVIVADGNWNLGDTFSASQHFDSGNKYGNITLQAQWKTATYTVTYKANGGVGDDIVDTRTYGEPYTTRPANTFTRNGYNLVKWNNNADGSGSYNYTPGYGNLAETNVDRVLYAQWSPITYTITYDANGGSVTPATQDYNIESTNVNLATPDREGYNFTGWKPTANDGNWTAASYAAGAAVTGQYGNVTLTAQWEIKTFQVRGKFADGDPSASAGTVTNGNQTRDYGEEYDTIAFTPIPGYYVSRIDFEGNGTTSYVTMQPPGANQYNPNPTASYYAVPKKTYSDIWYVATSSLIDFYIYYDANGGELTQYVDGDHSQQYTVLDSFQLATAPTREGYKFKGWKPQKWQEAILSSSAWNTEDLYEAGQSVGPGKYCRVKMVAQWEVDPDQTYTVTYAVEGHGSVNPTSQSDQVLSNANITGSTATPDTGYELVGWYKGASPIADDATAITTDAVLSPDDAKANLNKNGTLYADTTYTAKFEPNTYTVTFVKNAEDAADPSPASKTVTYDAAYGDLATTSRPGYDFNGWWTAATGGSKVTASTTVTTASNHSLYAHWTARTDTAYTVLHIRHNYDGTNGVEGDPKYDASLKETVPMTGTTGQSTAAEAKSYPGYTVRDGWTQETIAGDGSTVVTIHYDEQSVTINYVSTDTAKGTVSLASETVGAASGKTAAGAAISGSTAAVTNSALYEFIGWYKDSACTQAVDSTWVTSGKLTPQKESGVYQGTTYYAKFAATQYTITYNSDGGKTTPDPQNYTYDSTDVTFAAAPEKDGYTFQWWQPTTTVNQAWSNTNRFVPGTQVLQKWGDVTLKAIWSANSYTITYDANGGQLPDGVDNPFGYKITDSVTLVTPTRDGFTFLGWEITSDTTGTAGNWPAKDTLIAPDALAVGDGKWGNVTLEAQWEEVTTALTIEVKVNGAQNDDQTLDGSASDLTRKFAGTPQVTLYTGGSVDGGEPVTAESTVDLRTEPYSLGNGDAALSYTVKAGKTAKIITVEKPSDYRLVANCTIMKDGTPTVLEPQVFATSVTGPVEISFDITDADSAEIVLTYSRPRIPPTGIVLGQDQHMVGAMLLVFGLGGMSAMAAPFILRRKREEE